MIDTWPILGQRTPVNLKLGHLLGHLTQADYLRALECFINNL